jgi:hypothetical protein
MHERFFSGTLTLMKGKDVDLRVAWHCLSFKAPSTYASATTVHRLASAG